MRIRVLSDLTINQIAAGEVIENPASVVKELVENAIDAGARHVKIETLGGGFQLIRVSDDGSGMGPEDALLCLERHATSKLVQAEDLFSLCTMGFRGEALASIAAISKMRLLTAEEGKTATEVDVEGGKVVHRGQGARSRGTTLEVRSLFFNVPARKEFQKSPSASSAEITRVLTHLALAHPEVGFDLIQQNRPHFSLLPSSGEDFLNLLKQRSEILLGKEFFTSCREIVFKEKDYEGRGFVLEPQFSRHNRSGQYLFVNKRPVICPAIAFSIRDAFGTRLETGKHPVFLLHLQIPSPLVDVNVHPQKKEIRLRQEGIVKYVLHAAVNGALASGGMGVEPPHPIEFSSFFTPATHIPDFSPAFILKEEETSSPAELNLRPTIFSIGLFGSRFIARAEGFPEFIFSPGDSRSLGVVWVDLPAAEARVQFDALVNRSESIPHSQGLLFPISLNFSKAEAELLQMNLPLLQKLGIDVRLSGETAFMVEGIPPFIPENEIHALFHEILFELRGEHEEKTWKERALRHLAAVLARKHRFSRNHYSQERALLIVEKLLQTSDPLHCPQGKRTLFHVREEEIEKYFTK